MTYCAAGFATMTRDGTTPFQKPCDARTQWLSVIRKALGQSQISATLTLVRTRGPSNTMISLNTHQSLRLGDPEKWQTDGVSWRVMLAKNFTIRGGHSSEDCHTDPWYCSSVDASQVVWLMVGNSTVISWAIPQGTLIQGMVERWGL